MLSVIIIGQCRKREIIENTAKQLAEISNLTKKIEVIVSTWPEDEAEYRSAFKASKLLDYDIILNEKPAISILGSFVHQQILLKSAARRAKGKAILKTRSDISFSYNFLWEKITKVLFEMQFLDKDYEKCNVKTWAPWVDIEEPFHIADECFIMSKKKFEEFVTFDIEGLAKYGFPGANIHTLFFGRRYWNKYKVFDSFLRAERRHGISFNRASEDKFKILDIAVKHKPFVAMIAIYWSIIINDFDISADLPNDLQFYPGGGESIASWYKPQRSVPNSFQKTFSSDYAGHLNHFYRYNGDAIFSSVASFSKSNDIDAFFLHVWLNIDGFMSGSSEDWDKDFDVMFDSIKRDLLR